MYYSRTITNIIKNNFFKGKAIVIVGSRQVGKTTLCQKIITDFKKQNKSVYTINADNPSDRDKLNNKDLEQLKPLVANYDVVFIDEGQKIETIGQTLKLLVDFYKNSKQFIVTGSSSFHLLDLSAEPLTGRKRVFYLYPLSQLEIYGSDLLLAGKNLENTLIYGSYPEVETSEGIQNKQDALREISSGVLYKDILEFQLIKNPTVLQNLLKALALQVGNEVSYNELSNLLGIDNTTVEKYIDLLEKSFVIFRLSPFFTNKRKEISKSKKIYFYDTGIRNAILQNFNSLDLRSDIGALWENFLIAERIKNNTYSQQYPRIYFWRTLNQSEIDYLEEKNLNLTAFEFKWNSRKARQQAPKPFQSIYPNASFTTITPENYQKFIGLE